MYKTQELITINKIGEKDGRYWIVGDNKEIYGNFKEWKGEDNLHYTQLKTGNHNQPFKEGDSALIEYTKQVGKDGKVYNKIQAIYPEGSTPTPSRVEKPRVEAPVASQGAEKPSAQYWEDKALAQCLWNYWLRNKEDVPRYWKQEVYKVFKEINEFVENPTEEVGDDVDVSKIPF